MEIRKRIHPQLRSLLRIAASRERAVMRARLVEQAGGYGRWRAVELGGGVQGQAVRVENLEVDISAAAQVGGRNGRLCREARTLQRVRSGLRSSPQRVVLIGADAARQQGIEQPTKDQERQRDDRGAEQRQPQA